MSAALALAVQSSSELYAYSFDRLTKAIGALLDRAVAAGEIRADISPEDLLRALSACATCTTSPAGNRRVLRLLDVFVDGLAGAAGGQARQREAVKDAHPSGKPRSASDRLDGIRSQGFSPRKSRRNIIACAINSGGTTTIGI